MKPRFPSLVACFLVLATAVSFAAGPGAETKTGTLVSFTGTSLRLAYADKAGNPATVNLVIDGKTVVKRLDQTMSWLDVARKGLAVSVTHEGVFATAVQVPFYGLESQGVGAATDEPGIYGVWDIRVNTTDSNLSAASERKDAKGRLVSKVELIDLPPETDGAWSLANSKTLMIGNIDVIPDTVRVSFDGMLHNVVYAQDGKGVFLEPAGTSCIVDKTKGVTTIVFDKELGKNFGEVSPRLKLSFDKKMLALKTTEVTYLELDPTCVVEVNGRPGTIAQATGLANFWLIRCNTDNRLVHVDSYFVDRPATFLGAASGMIVVDAGETLALPLSDGVTVLAPAGAANIADLVPGTKVLLTTEPADAYRVVLVSAVK